MFYFWWLMSQERTGWLQYVHHDMTHSTAEIVQHNMSHFFFYLFLLVFFISWFFTFNSIYKTFSAFFKNRDVVIINKICEVANEKNKMFSFEFVVVQYCLYHIDITFKSLSSSIVMSHKSYGKKATVNPLKGESAQHTWNCGPYYSRQHS